MADVTGCNATVRRARNILPCAAALPCAAVREKPPPSHGAQLVAATVDLKPDSQPTGQTMLMPDPAAQNNRLDLQAAVSFYRRAQQLSVPLVVISRHLSHACRVPAELFDILATHGGQLGKTVRDEQRESFNMLWQRACAPSGEASRRKPTWLWACAAWTCWPG